MTGSNLAAIVIPIVVMFGLAVWIALVFHADSHPLWRDRTARATSKTRTPQRRPVAVRTPLRSHPAGTVRRARAGAAH